MEKQQVVNSRLVSLGALSMGKRYRLVPWASIFSTKTTEPSEVDAATPQLSSYLCEQYNLLIREANYYDPCETWSELNLFPRR